jgi:hypothetical protein
MSQTIILFEEEPITSVLGKWITWMAIMIVFVMCLIYFSNYFAFDKGCHKATTRIGI